MPIIEALCQRSREWDLYFQSHTPEDLRIADLEEVNACWELIAAYPNIPPIPRSSPAHQ